MNKSLRGFTIVELLIVIVVIAILAAISVVAYTGIQNRAHDATLASTMSQLQKSIELYKAQHGQYPQTHTSSLQINSTSFQPHSDTNCTRGGNIGASWIPGLDINLPQSDPNHKGATRQGTGVQDPGCYMYISDGTNYVLSAWNMRKSPDTTSGYRRSGFMEFHDVSYIICNHVNIGGRASGTYNISQDYYKYSYTYSNITGCNETPPAGA